MAAELPGAVVSGVAAKATESAYDFIRRQISYAFQYQRYVEDMKKQVEELKYARQRVEVSVEDAKRQGEEIFDDVEVWRSRVDNFMETANLVTQDEDNANKWCFKGLCPNLIERYKLSKKARNAKNDGDDLLNKGNFSTVSHRPVLQKTESMYVKDDYEAFDSRMSTFQNIMEALNDPNIKLIGVHGMGGVGKTTLVSKVAWQAMEDKLFDTVVMFEVTRTPNHKKIQEKIAYDLGLEFDKETEVQRVGRIHEKLKKEKSVLVILDNIWKEFDLRAVGIPFGHDEKEIKDGQRRWKILLTSRNQYVLSNDMNAQKNFLIKILSEGEAENLFKRIVDDSLKDSDFQRIAVEIIKKCDGLPLAIATIAKALKRKELCVWKDTLNKLQVSTSKHSNEVDKKVFSTIKVSYDFLESEETKKIFLLCSLYNAGYEIYTYDLLRFGMGLSLFQGAGKLEHKRHRLCSLIDQLKASSLLLDGNTKDMVKMHDIIHVVAVSIASTDEHMSNIQEITDLEQQFEEIPKDSTAISLPFKGINELPERLEFSKLELFLLFEKDCSLQIPDLFFEETKQLKVLDLRGINFPSLPSSFPYLTNLKTLSLKNCQLGDIAMIGKLKRLESLSFSKSKIEQLPREIGELTRLKILDLSKCSELKVIAPNVISKLSQLEELHMLGGFVAWDQGRNNASLNELNELSHLTTLDIFVPDAQIMRWDLNFEKLESYKLIIGEEWYWLRNYESSRTLKLKLNGDIFSRYDISTLLKRAEDLYLDELTGVQNVLYGLDGEGFPQLKHLDVNNISTILYIIHWAGSAPCNAFPKLESLYLSGLCKLEKICHCQLTAESFGNLRIVNVVGCRRLNHLFSFSLAKNLSQLQEIDVKYCRNLTEIFSQESEDHAIQNERNKEIEFNQLRSLTLDSLPQLKSFALDMNSSSRSRTFVASNTASTEIISMDESPDFVAFFNPKVVFPRLKTLVLYSIRLGKIWPNEPPVMLSYSQTLTRIIVEECSGLKFLFPSSVLNCLEQLQILKIDNCASMEEIINTEGLRGEEKIIKFPKLSKLVLRKLPKLTRFGTGDFVEFPSLKDLQIDDCRNLETFLSSSSNAKRVSKEHETTNSGNCSADICHLFNEKVRFPNLEVLEIHSVHNITSIWCGQKNLNPFSKLRDLTVKSCHKLLSVIPSNMLGRLQRLDMLHVSNCDSIEVIFEPQALGEEIPTQLRQLKLIRLPKLKRVWDMDIQGSRAFQNLVSINVEMCYNLKSLFPTSITRSLLQLEELKISVCYELEEIVANVEGIETVDGFVFPKLILLELIVLPKLKTFFRGTHISEWPVLSLQETQGESQHDISLQQSLFLVDKVEFLNLEVLTIYNMDNVNRIWNRQINLESFSKLRALTVNKCNKLLCVIPSNMLGRLQRLEKLDVSFCDLIEVIFESQAHNEEILAQLRQLKLNGLPKLKHVWDMNIQGGQAFQNLVSMNVWRCNNLKSLFPTSIARSLLQLEDLDISDCDKLEEIVAKVEGIKTVHTFVYPKLTSLRLSGLPKLNTFFPGTHISKWPVLKKLTIVKCDEVKIFASQFSGLQESHGEIQHDISLQQSLFSVAKVGFPNLEELYIRGMYNMNIIWNEQINVNLFSKLRALTVRECNQLLRVIPSNMLRRLQSLENLIVSKCDSIEVIFKPLVHGEEIPTQLRKLEIDELPNLKYAWDMEVREVLAFQNLVSVQVMNCKSLKGLFSTSIARSLLQLEGLEISGCDVLEEIVAKVEGMEIVHRFGFPKLTLLRLSKLPRLKTFFRGIHISEWPILKKLIVVECEKVKIFAAEILSLQETQGVSQHDISILQPLFLVDKDAFHCLEKLRLHGLPELLYLWKENSQLRNSFQNLVSLEVSQCVRLRYLMSHSTAKNLVHLQRMTITNCKIIETIITHFEDEGNDQIIFNQLKDLSLKDLESLTSFCIGEYTLKFPYLKQVIVSKCPKMEIFSQGVLDTSNLQEVQGEQYFAKILGR